MVNKTVNYSIAPFKCNMEPRKHVGTLHSDIHIFYMYKHNIYKGKTLKHEHNEILKV